MTAVSKAATPTRVAAPAPEVADDGLVPCARCRETGIDPYDFGECVDCAGRRYVLAPDPTEDE